MLNELEIKAAIAVDKSAFLRKLDIYMPSKFNEVGHIKKIALKANPILAINALCIGYLYEGRIVPWYDIKKVIDCCANVEITVSKMIENPIYMYKINNKIKLIKKSDIHKIIGSLSIDKLSEFLSIRISDFEISAKVFGLRTSKEKLLGETHSEYTIESGKSKELNADTYYVTVPYKNKNIKFCVCDIEFILPSFKGYNFPKDKSLTVGKQVRYKKSDKCDCQVLTVTNIKLNKFSFKNSIVTVFDGMKHKKMYAKNLKVIC